MAPVRERLAAGARRARIEDAALEAFAEYGYEGASMRTIAAHAGITTPILYDHFESKKALHLELLEREATALLERVTRLPSSAHPADYMREPFDAFFAFVQEHRFAWRVLFRDPPQEPQIAELHRDVQRRATAAIAGLFALTPRWAVTPRLGRARATELLAEITKSALNGLAAWWWEHPETKRSVLVDLAMDALWTGAERLRAEGPA